MATLRTFAATAGSPEMIFPTSFTETVESDADSRTRRMVSGSAGSDSISRTSRVTLRRLRAPSRPSTFSAAPSAFRAGAGPAAG